MGIECIQCTLTINNDIYLPCECFFSWARKGSIRVNISKIKYMQNKKRNSELFFGGKFGWDHISHHPIEKNILVYLPVTCIEMFSTSTRTNKKEIFRLLCKSKFQVKYSPYPPSSQKLNQDVCYLNFDFSILCKIRVIANHVFWNKCNC